MTATTTLPVLFATGIHSARPAASAVGAGGLYSCTTHSLIYQTDGSSTWSTWATMTAGLADHSAFTYLDATDAAAPANPSSGFARIYSKSGRIYSRDSSGTEYGPFDASGGAASPLLYADNIALSASGDTFPDATLTGWTTGGSPSAATVTTEVYDAHCIALTLPSQSDRIYKTCPVGDFTAYLTIHGVTNATPSPNTALNGMLALVFTDNSGNGTGMSLYSDGNGYMWAVVSHAYSATGNTIVTTWSSNTATVAAASSWPIVYRLAKVGSTITGGISFNGGASYVTNTRTDSTTFTRMGVTRLFTSGGTNPKLTIGRFNTA